MVAEALRREGLGVAPVTSRPRVSAWRAYTAAQERTQARLLELDVDAVTGQALEGFDGGAVDLACVYTGRVARRAAASLAMVTARTPGEERYRALTADAISTAGISSVTRIGDGLAPSTSADAVSAAPPRGR